MCGGRDEDRDNWAHGLVLSLQLSGRHNWRFESCAVEDCWPSSPAVVSNRTRPRPRGARFSWAGPPSLSSCNAGRRTRTEFLVSLFLVGGRVGDAVTLPEDDDFEGCRRLIGVTKKRWQAVESQPLSESVSEKDEIWLWKADCRGDSIIQCSGVSIGAPDSRIEDRIFE